MNQASALTQQLSMFNFFVHDVCVSFKGMTVLNKSKWKGGTLQIETAKESFLHRYSRALPDTKYKNTSGGAGFMIPIPQR